MHHKEGHGGGKSPTVAKAKNPYKASMAKLSKLETSIQSRNDSIFNNANELESNLDAKLKQEITMIVEHHSNPPSAVNSNK